VAFAILDGIEAGHEDIFLDRQIAAMTAAMLSRSAA
jgi:hypothetical protein